MQLRLVVSTMVEMNRDLLRCEETALGKQRHHTATWGPALLYSLDKDVALPEVWL